MNSEKKSALLFFMLILGLVMLVTVSGCSKQTVAQGVEEKLTLANKYLMEQKYEEAILAFQNVIKIDPKNIKARIGLAQAYVATEKYDKAEASLKEVISIDEKNFQAYTDLIKLYEKMKKDKKEIISLLKTAFEKTGDPSFKLWLEQYSSNESKTGEPSLRDRMNSILFSPENAEEHFKSKGLWSTLSCYLDTSNNIAYTGIINALGAPKDANVVRIHNPQIVSYSEVSEGFPDEVRQFAEKNKLSKALRIDGIYLNEKRSHYSVVCVEGNNFEEDLLKAEISSNHLVYYDK